jgi:hypothetical protein
MSRISQAQEADEQQRTRQAIAAARQARAAAYDALVQQAGQAPAPEAAAEAARPAIEGELKAVVRLEVFTNGYSALQHSDDLSPLDAFLLAFQGLAECLRAEMKAEAERLVREERAKHRQQAQPAEAPAPEARKRRPPAKKGDKP